MLKKKTRIIWCLGPDLLLNFNFKWMFVICLGLHNINGKWWISSIQIWLRIAVNKRIFMLEFKFTRTCMLQKTVLLKLFVHLGARELWWMHIWPLNCFLMINKTQSNKINSWKWTFFFYTHNLFLLLRRLRTIEQCNFGYCGTYLYKPEQKEIKFLVSWLALTLGMI